MYGQYTQYSAIMEAQLVAQIYGLVHPQPWTDEMRRAYYIREDIERSREPSEFSGAHRRQISVISQEATCTLDREAEREQWERTIRLECQAWERATEQARLNEQEECRQATIKKTQQALLANENLKHAFDESVRPDADGFMHIGDNERAWRASEKVYQPDSFSLWFACDPRTCHPKLIDSCDKVITSVLQKNEQLSRWGADVGEESHLVFDCKNWNRDEEYYAEIYGIFPAARHLDVVLPPTDGICFSYGEHWHLPLAWFLEYPSLFRNTLSREDIPAATRFCVRYLFGDLSGTKYHLTFRLRSPRVASHALMLIESAQPDDQLFKELIKPHNLQRWRLDGSPDMPSTTEQWQDYLNWYIIATTEVITCPTPDSCLASIELGDSEAFRFPHVDNWHYGDPMLHHLLREQCYFDWCTYFYPDHIKK